MCGAHVELSVQLPRYAPRASSVPDTGASRRGSSRGRRAGCTPMARYRERDRSWNSRRSAFGPSSVTGAATCAAEASNCEPVPVILVAHGLQPVRESLCVAVLAAGADLVATRYRVPCCVCPFDGGIRGHGAVPSLLGDIHGRNVSHTRIIVFVLMDSVAVPKDTIWPIEPHTSAKHQILRKYLDAWLPILGTYNKRIVYIDGFSGPGEYTGGEPGSPIIALEAARTHQCEVGRGTRLPVRGGAAGSRRALEWPDRQYPTAGALQSASGARHVRGALNRTP